MRKRLDNLTAILFFAMAAAVLLAGSFCLRRSIIRARAEPLPLARTRLEPPELEPLPTPAPDGPTYNPAIPLGAELQAALCEACAEADVPVALALGVIQVESGFRADAVSAGGCYGLMQLNPRYFPDKLSPADNLRAGVAYLGRLLERYGDPGAALCAYNAGRDTGRRGYANAVLAAAEGWAASG